MHLNLLNSVLDSHQVNGRALPWYVFHYRRGHWHSSQTVTESQYSGCRTVAYSSWWHIAHGRAVDDLTAIYCGPLQSGRINSHQTILVPYTALIDLCRNTVNFSVFVIIIVMCSSQNDWLSVTFEIRIQYVSLDLPVSTVYPKKYAHGFVVLCFVVVMQSFIMNSHEVFNHRATGHGRAITPNWYVMDINIHHNPSK